MTIRQRLALALLAALVPVLLLTAAPSVLAYRHEGDQRRQTLTLAAKRAAERADARIESAGVVLEAIAPQTVGLRCAQFLQRAQQRLRDFDALIRFDRIGRVACAGAAVPQDLERRNAAWFRRLREGQLFVIDEAPAGVVSDGPAVIAAVRAETADGVFDGVQLAVLNVDRLRPERDLLPQETDVALISADGAFLLRPRREELGALPQGWRERARERGVYIFRGRLADGRWRQHAVAPIAGGEVFTVLSTADPGLFSWARLNPMSIIVLPLLSWLFAAVAVFLASEGAVVRWVRYLERIAADYAEGKFSGRADQARHAPQELRTLGRTLDQMAEKIVGRDQSLRHSLEEKDLLMREIHHRVKNNLQIITSLLNMQQRAVPDPAARAALSDTRQRITALALIYRALYQSEDLRQVDVRIFLSELLGQLMNSDTRRETPVSAELEADSLIIDPEKLAPFALFAVEAIGNAQKHAFPQRGGRIDVRFTVRGEEARLEVADDGVGADPATMGAGVGRTLMTAFARQLRGSAEIGPRPQGGVAARLTFPIPAGSRVGAAPGVRASSQVEPQGNQAAA